MNDTDRGIPVSKSSLTRIQFLCLIVAAFLEGLMIFIGKMNGRMLYKPFHDGLLFCSLVFTGTVIFQAIKYKTRYPLILPAAMAIWFTVIQLHQHAAGMTTQPYGMFLSSYLLAFPFAMVTQDSKKQIALKTAAFLYIAATLVLVLYSILLIADCVPSFMINRLFWNSFRLTVIHHPNITARAFMISFAFCLGFAFLFPQRWIKGLFLIVALLIFAALSLTSSRTAILLACFLCAGVIFFAVYRGRFRQLICGAVMGLAAALCLFLFSNALFQWNVDRLTDSGTPAESSLEQMPGTEIQEVSAEQIPYRIMLLSNSEQTSSESKDRQDQDVTANSEAPLSAKKGIVVEDGAMYYYEDGVRSYAGLIQIDGDYYYVNSKCIVVTGRYEIHKTNGLMEADTYMFDETGKMIPMKNGIIEEEGILYYYEDGVRTYAGLIQIDGDYYYVNSKCIVVTGRYEIHKTNGLMKADTYMFDETGKMIPMKNGIIEEDGILYYYEDGVRTYAGLILIDGDYYYVNSAGIVVTGSYKVYKTNGLMEAGTYIFDESGKMVTDPAAYVNSTAEQSTIGEDLPTLNGRTKIWRLALMNILEDPSIMLWGCDNTAKLVETYGASHTHNSWLEIFARLGLPGILISLLFTIQAIWASVELILRRGVDLWGKTISMLVLCLMASGMLEPNLFFTEEVWHYVDFMFFLCLGYIILWRKQLPLPLNDND